MIDSIILLQLIPGFRQKIPLLDKVDDGDIVPTLRYIHFYSSVSRSTQGSNIYDLNLKSDSLSDSTLEVSTLGSQHTAENK